MGKWWQHFKGKTTTKMVGVSNLNVEEAALEKYVRRLSEVQDELSEIGTIFESSIASLDINASQHQLLEQITLAVNKIRIPGFCAYKLAEEGLVLLNLIAVGSLSLRKVYEQSGNSSQLKKLSHLQDLIDTTIEPLMRQTLEEMTPYSTMDGRKIIESIAARCEKDKHRS